MNMCVLLFNMLPFASDGDDGNIIVRSLVLSEKNTDVIMGDRLSNLPVQV